MTTPAIGRIVHFRFGNHTDIKQYNQSYIHPAMIVRAWGVETVNVKVITDGPEDVWSTSVKVVPAEPEEHTTEPVCWFP